MTNNQVPMTNDEGKLDFLRINPRHQFPQPAADIFELVVAFAAAGSLEAGCAGFGLQDPFTSELTGLDFLEDLRHLLAGLVGHNPRSRRVVAEFSRVADAVSHAV